MLIFFQAIFYICLFASMALAEDSNGRAPAHLQYAGRIQPSVPYPAPDVAKRDTTPVFKAAARYPAAPEADKIDATQAIKAAARYPAAPHQADESDATRAIKGAAQHPAAPEADTSGATPVFKTAVRYPAAPEAA